MLIQNNNDNNKNSNSNNINYNNNNNNNNKNDNNNSCYGGSLFNTKLKVALEILIKKTLNNHVRKSTILNVDLIEKKISEQQTQPNNVFPKKKSLIKRKMDIL